MNTLIDAISILVEDKLPDSSPLAKEIIRDNFELALMEGMNLHRLRRDADARSHEAPVRELSPEELSAIKDIGKKFSWNERGDDQRNPAQWIIDYYGDWIPGLLKHHLRQADFKLYESFLQHAGRHGLPENIDIPSAKENETRKLNAMLTGQTFQQKDAIDERGERPTSTRSTGIKQGRGDSPKNG